MLVMYLINVRRQGVETARKFLDRIEARGVVDGVVEDERAAMCFSFYNFASKLTFYHVMN